MNSGPTTRRRWFQFGLGSMFVAVTVFAVWLGWELKYVRERKPMLERIAAHGIIEYPPIWQRGVHYHPTRVWTPIQTGTQRLPVAWGFLGAKPIACIYIDHGDFSSTEIAKMQRHFPEADITEWYVPDGPINGEPLRLRAKP